MLSLLDVAASFCNRAANYQSWKQDLVADRRWLDSFGREEAQNVRRGQDILATISLAFAHPSQSALPLSFRRLTARQPIQNAPLVSSGSHRRPRLLALCFLPSCPLPRLISPPYFLPHFQGGSTASCWQLFRVLKRPWKKFWLLSLLFLPIPFSYLHRLKFYRFVFSQFSFLAT